MWLWVPLKCCLKLLNFSDISSTCVLRYTQFQFLRIALPAFLFGSVLCAILSKPPHAINERESPNILSSFADVRALDANRMECRVCSNAGFSSSKSNCSSNGRLYSGQIYKNLSA